MGGWETWARGKYRGPTHQGQVERAKTGRSTLNPRLRLRERWLVERSNRRTSGLGKRIHDRTAAHSGSFRPSLAKMDFPRFSRHRWLIESPAVTLISSPCSRQLLSLGPRAAKSGSFQSSIAFIIHHPAVSIELHHIPTSARCSSSEELVTLNRVSTKPKPAHSDAILFDPTMVCS